MVFVDNALNPSTGTIRARAVLPNKDRVFTPGLFARVQLLGSGQREAILVNERALLTDQDRRYVYVVGDDNKAIRRDVQLGARPRLRIVRGPEAGRPRVVNGVRKIFFPGMPVKALDVPMEQPEPPGAARRPRRPRPADTGYADSTPTPPGSSSTGRSSRPCCRS